MHAYHTFSSNSDILILKKLMQPIYHWKFHRVSSKWRGIDFLSAIKKCLKTSLHSSLRIMNNTFFPLHVLFIFIGIFSPLHLFFFSPHFISSLSILPSLPVVILISLLLSRFSPLYLRTIVMELRNKMVSLPISDPFSLLL